MTAIFRVNKMTSTSDASIRAALKRHLESHHLQDDKLKIFEELGVSHGSARIDIAVVNGLMHGYEIKSDRDTLERLPDQVKEFSAVFDRITLVVGKCHLYHAIHMIPDWWGIMVAKEDTNKNVFFQTIRKPDNNKEQVGLSLARLLWRKEALQILENRNAADELRYMPRKFIYEKLAAVLDTDILKELVSMFLVSREGWRSDALLLSSDD